MSTLRVVEESHLASTVGGSDKVYKLELLQSSDGWLVRYTNGPRGGSLKTELRTASPVDEAEARKLYLKVIKQKKSDGYVDAANITTYVPPAEGTEQADENLVIPQLLNPMSDDEVPTYIADPRWGMQEKKDGHRMTLERTASGLTARNRKGQVRAYPVTLTTSIEALPAGTILDGEHIGDVFFAFDLLKEDGEDIRGLSVLARSIRLANLLPHTSGSDAVLRVPLESKQTTKQALHDRLRASGAEGVVFKRLDAPYTSGRPNSGGPQLKCKFYATATVRVKKKNVQRSCAMEVLTPAGSWRAVGNVTLPPSETTIAVGDLIEVRYLYAYPKGSLFQPTFLMRRTDVGADAATESQLRWKSQDSDDEEPEICNAS